MSADTFDWASLPWDLGYGLLVAGVGKPHLLGLAQKALAETRTVGLGLNLFLGAWESGPLDGGLAKVLLELDQNIGFLPSPVKAMALTVAEHWHLPRPEALEEMAKLAQARQHKDLAAMLTKAVKAEPGNLFWRQHLLDLSYLLADWDQAHTQVKWLDQAGIFPDIQAKISGDILYQTSQWEQALEAYARSSHLRPAQVRLGQCFFKLGQMDQARTAWTQAWEQAPWNASLLLRLADRMAGLDQPGNLPPGQVVVCLYTKDKAQDLDNTLRALAGSELGGARLVVLDNASQDATPVVLAAWKDRLAQAMSVITLPVNIGAPAARNWLKHLEQVAQADFVAYLDDDALVEPDWLRYFGQAVLAYPRAGVWGCKVVDLEACGRMQNVDLHLAQPDEGPAPATPGLQDLDFGQFDYLRPCLSVTGCCHLFRTKDLMDSADFDIRYSPTQYDDLDHDLALCTAGKAPVYQGFARVLHARASGALLNLDLAATANSQANLDKLAGKYPPRQRKILAKKDYQAMLKDLLDKQKLLRA